MVTLGGWLTVHLMIVLLLTLVSSHQIERHSQLLHVFWLAVLYWRLNEKLYLANDGTVVTNLQTKWKFKRRLDLAYKKDNAALRLDCHLLQGVQAMQSLNSNNPYITPSTSPSY